MILSLDISAAVIYNKWRSGCGSVWLERFVRDEEAASSNLVTPIVCSNRKPAWPVGLRFCFVYITTQIWLPFGYPALQGLGAPGEGYPALQGLGAPGEGYPV